MSNQAEFQIDILVVKYQNKFRLDRKKLCYKSLSIYKVT